MDGLTGLAGGRLAGILQNDRERPALGGFGAAVDSDPATITQVVAQPGNVADLDPWPPVSSRPLTVEPGYYWLVLYAAPNLGRADPSNYPWWVPAESLGESPGVRACRVYVIVADDPVTLTVHDVPECSRETSSG